MLGEIALEAVYGRRLDLIRPTRAQVDALGQMYIAGVVPDARAVIAALRGEGVAVRVMSGGLLPAVAALAALRIPATDGVRSISFRSRGTFTGFDRRLPSRAREARGDVACAGAPRPICSWECATAWSGAGGRSFAFAASRGAAVSRGGCSRRAHSLAPLIALASETPSGDPPRARCWPGRSLLSMTDSLPSLLEIKRTDDHPIIGPVLLPVPEYVARPRAQLSR